MTVRRSLILPLAGSALAATGCGSSSHKTAQATTHEKMPMTHTSTSMAMGHESGMTAASMAGKSVEHAEVTFASSRHYGNVLYDKDHFVLYEFSADHGSTSTCYGPVHRRTAAGRRC